MSDVQTFEVALRQNETTTMQVVSIPCRWIDEASVGTHRAFIEGHVQSVCDCGSVHDITVPFEVTFTIEAKAKKRRRWFWRGEETEPK